MGAINLADLGALWPLWTVLGGAFVVVFLDVVSGREHRYGLPLVTAGAAGLAAFFSLGDLGLDPRFLFVPRGVTAQMSLGVLAPLRADGFAAGVDLAVLLAVALCALSSWGATPPGGRLRPGEYYGLLLLAAGGMMLLSRAADLLLLLLGLEVMSLAVYVLAGTRPSDPRSGESAMKYFVLGGFATAFLLFGMGLFFGATGSISLLPALRLPDGETMRLWQDGPDEWMLRIALVMMLVGFCFKIGAVPFHAWVPDVYEGAPTPVTGFMAVAVKAAAFAAMLRVLADSFSGASGEIFWGKLVDRWQVLLGAIAAVTMIYGNVVAIRQRSVKRMLAYSGIAHSGYLLLSLLGRPEEPMQLPPGVVALLFYLLCYAFATAGAFAVVSLARENGEELEALEDYAGLAKRRPAVALAMALFLFSLAGLPPLCGFAAKVVVFTVAIEAGFVWLAVLGVLTSVVSLYYYLRVVVMMYMREGEGPGEEERGLAAPVWGQNFVLALAAVGVVLLGVLPGLVLRPLCTVWVVW